METNIRVAKITDTDSLVELFINNLEKHSEYFSHGEMQMGLKLVAGKVSKRGINLWKKYAQNKIRNKDSKIFVYEDNNKITGFIIVEISEDGADPFGVICDLYVLPNNRTKGIGSSLFDIGIGWLRARGMKDFYLESGKDNHAAHAFFEKRGFGMVSHVYHKS